MSVFSFGEEVAGYEGRVLNEREVRAAAGVLFLVMFVSINLVVFRWDFTALKIATVSFLVDFLIRVFVSPRYAPTLVLGRLIVGRQTPEYVGAPQKQFAWVIGIILAVTMTVLMVVLNLHTPINGLICMVCLVFLFFEAAFGICLGCKVYPLLFRKKVQYCPGEVCEVKDRQPIQHVSLRQLVVLVLFVGAVIAMGFAFGDRFAKAPELAMGMEQPPHTLPAKQP